MVPEDCLMEILQWLPAKTLCKLKTVSKTFLKLISDPFIQTLHANHVKTGISIINITRSTTFEIIPIDHDVFSIPTESLLFLTKYSRKIMATLRGLIVFKSSLNDFRVLNPFTKNFSIISPPPGMLMHYMVLGLRSINDKDYEMICAINKISKSSGNPALEFWRYLSGDMSWEYLAEVDSIVRCIVLHLAVFLSGFVFWPVSFRLNITDGEYQGIVFDIERRRLESVLLPEEFSRVRIRQIELSFTAWPDGSLCMIQNKKKERRIVIWLMRSPFSSQMEWIKVHEINLRDFGLKGKPSCHTMIRDELLVFSTNNSVRVYSFYEHSVKKVGRFKESQRDFVIPYVGTFLPCGKVEQSIMSME
ncbi:F-box protein CPR1 [Dioscorea cayenensis subsp. rotundata]|uniref:F-box protein CPR1 n=1 Tax=Dioscorea cayennensis subsp. rotundata TaxID=55577 RepID=A0AB40CMW6_DIOCR|nr:F-box protein CPR1 [Dioscorea cayenensis subsp. rotundata]